MTSSLFQKSKTVVHIKQLSLTNAFFTEYGYHFPILIFSGAKGQNLIFQAKNTKKLAFFNFFDDVITFSKIEVRGAHLPTITNKRFFTEYGYLFPILRISGVKGQKLIFLG